VDQARLRRRPTYRRVLLGYHAAHLAVALLVQNGVLDLDQQVARGWPEFGAAGKSGSAQQELLAPQRPGTAFGDRALVIGAPEPLLRPGGFGHGGVAASPAFADPRSGLAYGYNPPPVRRPGGAAPETVRPVRASTAQSSTLDTPIRTSG
jgi:hypothetical protein